MNERLGEGIYEIEVRLNDSGKTSEDVAQYGKPVPLFLLQHQPLAVQSCRRGGAVGWRRRNNL